MSYRNDSLWNDKTELMCLVIFLKLKAENFPRGKLKKYCEAMSKKTGLDYGSISAKVCNYKSVAGINNPSNASNNTVEMYRKYGKSPISDIEKLIYGFNAPQLKPKTEPIQTKICECCRLKRSLSAFLTIDSKICRSCSLNNSKTKTKPDLRRICECCCTEQPLSAFSDNLGFSSFKTCQRCRDVVPNHNKRNRPRRLC